MLQVEFAENLRLAELEDAAAQFRVACAFQYGLGTTKNETKATMWFERSSFQGYEAAQGVCSIYGVGVTKNENAGFKLLRLSAQSRLPEVQFLLGKCYSGFNPQEAVKWLRLAADQGHAGAQSNLGVCNQNGAGVSQDAKKAVKWYRLAAAQGYAHAQCDLGVCYENGTGVPQDAKEAVKWYRLGVWRLSKGTRMRSVILALVMQVEGALLRIFGKPLGGISWLLVKGSHPHSSTLLLVT